MSAASDHTDLTHEAPPRTGRGGLAGAAAVAMAAGYTTEAAIRVNGDDIQLHGGVGFTWANDAHFLFKRAKQNEVLLGGHASHRARLAHMLTGVAS